MKKEIKEFQNCLRLQIIPDEFADERIDRLVSHCKKFGFNNVILLINGEDFFLGHITVDEVRPFVETAKKAAEKLRQSGISVSLHNWIGVGHADRGVGIKKEQNFTTMVDFNGREQIGTVCPNCENWRKYFHEYLGYLISEIKPDYYWIEDDFRLHNHTPLEWGGCFCKLHIDEFNKALGTSYTREEFCKKAFAKGKLNPERKAWLDSETKTMISLGAHFRKSVKDANEQTRLALMSSFPTSHCLEARDWNGIFEAISGDEEKINRIHLPGYFEISGKDYMYGINSISMAIRAFCPSDTHIMPELENGPIAHFRKTARYVRFQIEAALPLCLSGMTYNIYDNVGNGSIEEYGFAKEVKDVTPYMQAVMNEKISYSDLKGVIIPIDEKITYHKEIKNSFYDLETNLFNTAGYVSAMGLSFKFSKDKAFKDETVFLFGDSVYLFDDAEIAALFRDNKVVLDGGAVLLLKERGLLSLIGAENAELYKAESGYQSYEEIEGDEEIFSVKNFRASGRSAAGDFVKIDYTDSVAPLTRVYKSDRSLGWPSFVKRDNTLIVPFVIDKVLLSQFSELRHYLLTKFVKEQSKIIVDSKGECVNPYLYSGENGTHLVLINGSLENFEKTEFFIKGVEFEKIVAIDRDGAHREVAFTNKDGHITLDRPLEYMSSAVYKLM